MKNKFSKFLIFSLILSMKPSLTYAKLYIESVRSEIQEFPTLLIPETTKEIEENLPPPLQIVPKESNSVDAKKTSRLSKSLNWIYQNPKLSASAAITLITTIFLTLFKIKEKVKEKGMKEAWKEIETSDVETEKRKKTEAREIKEQVTKQIQEKEEHKIREKEEREKAKLLSEVKIPKGVYNLLGKKNPLLMVNTQPEQTSKPTSKTIRQNLADKQKAFKEEMEKKRYQLHKNNS